MVGLERDLMERLAAPENLLSAWREVRGNIPRYRRERSAGPDGVSLWDFEQDLTAQLNFLREALLTEKYHPRPPAMFRVQKKGGGQRMLAVLSVADRFAQRAAKQVLEPIWEPHFLDCSFGFRPGLSVEDALRRAQMLRDREKRWVVDGDIHSCFPSLDHDILMGQMKRRLRDRRVLDLVQAWLDAGILEAGPPQDDDSLLEKAQLVTRWVQDGTDWVLSHTVEEMNPYRESAYRYGIYEGQNHLNDIDALPLHDRDQLAAYTKRSALQQLGANGLLFGISWARALVPKIGGRMIAFLKSPAGRRFLRRSARASAVMTGVAAISAATAYLLNRRAGPAPAGVLQGSPLSPLLANIYLHLFDLMMTKRKHALVRFADDWVILTSTRRLAERSYKDAEWALDRLRLQLNPEKTFICHPDESVHWLGGVLR